jgi:hypothetical protein
VPGGGLHPAQRGGPRRQTQGRTGHRRDQSDENAVHDRDQPHVLLGGADGGQHPELAQPPLGHRDEPGGGEQGH